MKKNEACSSRSAVGNEAINEQKPKEEDAPVMDRTLYNVATKGQVETFLDLVKAADVEQNDETDAHRSSTLEAASPTTSTNSLRYLLRKTPAKNTILHLSLLCDQLEFAQTAASAIPQLISEINFDGNNAIHIAAQTGSVEVVEELVKSYQMYCEKLKADEGKDIHVHEPWRAKNKEGNTPLHVALIHGRVEVTCYLVELDHQLVRVPNNFKQTPLHLAVRHRTNDDPEEVEDMIKVVKLLLEKDNSVACWHDYKGLTPLLIAATNKPSHREALNDILDHCPGSAEVCDHSGNTFLHLMSSIPLGEEFRFRSDAPMAVMNMQNDEGDTPAHLAVKHQNIDMILLLHTLSANFAIVNKNDISVAALILDQSEDFRNTLKEKWKQFQWSLRNYRPKLSIQERIALREMDWKSLKNKMTEWGKSFFHKRDTVGNNILHFFASGNPRRFREDEFEEFISRALSSLPSLICEPGFCKSNPLHDLVERAPDLINKHILSTVEKHFKEFQRKSLIKELCYDPPWKAKDHSGNTILHFALTLWGRKISVFKYIECAKEILEFDRELANEVNNSGEMPLHKLVNVRLPALDTEGETVNKFWSNMKLITRKSGRAMIEPDSGGLVPLLRAARNHDIQFLLQLGIHGGLFSRDSEDNTFLHLLANMRVGENDAQRVEEICAEASAYLLLTKCNVDRNTPFHLAIMANNFELAHNFLNIYENGGEKLIDLATLSNNNGNTLLHAAAGKVGSPVAQSFIKKAYHSSLEGVLMSNKDGNTALHLAILNDDFELVAVIFDMFGSEATSVRKILETRDKDQNTPMNLAILEGKSRFIKLFLDIGEKAGCIVEILLMPNIRGDIPLHLALQVGNLEVANQIFDITKREKRFVDQVLRWSNEDQNTPLHLAILNRKSNFVDLFINKAQEKKCIPEVLKKCNKQGDTALHLAINNGDFPLAKKFIECAATTSCIDEILAIPNAKKETPGRLIGSHSHLPDQFEKFFWNEPKVVGAMIGVRSLSGVPTEIIKDYTNTIGVIAALFATISFTAAFTVPGGLNSNNGTPFLMKKAAFQVFLVSDIIAMCLSMMVLFFLMWIMTINNEKHQVILLDLTVFSLQGAFYTIILTFMTGLYVTVIPVIQWIAILACVLCSLLILLMHKRFVIWFIPSFIYIYVWSRRAYSWIKKLCGYVACCGCYNNNNKNGEPNEISSHANNPTGHTEAVVDISSVSSQDSS